MINIDLEKIIIQFINKQYRPRWISLKQEWKDYLLQRWNDCNNIKESYLRIKNNINEIPKCPVCGNKCNFRGANYIYDITCGNKICQNTLRNIKSKQTKLERYGDENYNNQIKAKQTKLKRYGDENYTNRKKAKNTCLKKYGKNNPFQVKEIQEKYKKTMIKKYGVDHNWKIKDEHKLTNTKEALEKKKQTSLKHYGVEYPHQLKIIKDKVNKTKKENGTLNTSKIEDQSHILLKEKYPDVKRQYRSELYPFNCDFYIPSLNLYIECQYGQFHHKRPYIGNEQDLKDIELLKEKADRIHK